MSIKFKKDGKIENLILHSTDIRVVDMADKFENKDLESVINHISDTEHIHIGEVDVSKDGIWVDNTENLDNTENNGVVERLKSFVNGITGKLSALTTDNKTSVVDAINEHEIQINDNATQLAENVQQLGFLEQLKLKFIYGAKGDGVTDDTIAIQNYLNENKIIYFLEKHLISNTLIVRNSSSLIGKSGIKTTILCDYNKMSDKNVMVIGDLESNSTSVTYLNDIYIYTDTYYARTKGILTYNSLNINRCKFFGLKVAIEKINDLYRDLFVARDCYFMYCTGDNVNNKYMIHLPYKTDSLLIDHCYVNTNYTESTFDKYNGIYIESSSGAINESVINVGVTLTNCFGFSLNNIHMEGSQDTNFLANRSKISINHSTVTITNAEIIANDKESVIEINNKDTNADSSRSSHIKLSNIIFSYPSRIMEKYAIQDQYDITKDKGTILDIENCCRAIAISGTRDFKYLGIKIKNNNDFNRNGDNSVNSIIDINNKVINNTPILSIGTNTLDSFQFSNRNSIIKCLNDDYTKNIYYRGVLVVDDTRKLALGKTTEDRIISSSTKTDGVLLRNGDYLKMGVKGCLYLFKGENSNNYNQLAKIPLMSSEFLYDFGTIVSGTRYEIVDSNVINSFSFVTYYKINGDNVEVNMTSIPTNGTWEVGDIVYNTNISAGGTKGWTCVTAGTPGVWKSFSLIES